MYCTMMRPCPSFPGYSATEFGEVISHRRRVGRQWIIDPNYANKLSGTLGAQGYRYVGVRTLLKPRIIRFHVVVTDAFYGPRPEGMLTRHLDGDKLNNCITNLAYGTNRENYEDAVVHGAFGDDFRSLSDQVVVDMLKAHAKGVSAIWLADVIGCGKTTVLNVLHGLTYKHIPR